MLTISPLVVSGVGHKHQRIGIERSESLSQGCDEGQRIIIRFSCVKLAMESEACPWSLGLRGISMFPLLILELVHVVHLFNFGDSKYSIDENPRLKRFVLTSQLQRRFWAGAQIQMSTFIAKDLLTTHLGATMHSERSEQCIDWVVNMRRMMISCMSEFITVMFRVLGAR